MLIKMQRPKLAPFSLILLLGSLTISMPTFAADTAKTSLDALKMNAGDEVGNEMKALKTEILVEKSEKQALVQVEKLLKRYKGTRLEPDLWLRKAELFMRRAKSARFFEINKDSKVVGDLTPKMLKSATSKEVVRQAIHIYGQLETRFPNYANIDLVIFNDAFARQQIGDGDKAEKLYWRLVQKYPDSPLVPDAHLALGEMWFQRKKFSEALAHFNAIKKYPEARVYPYGLYKAAWTYYNMRENLSAIKELEKVVEYGKYVAENNVEAKLDLRKEALTDMTMFYEDVYPAKNAYNYFYKQAGETEVDGIIMKLAQLYHRHSRYNDKETVLRELISEQPYSKLVPEAHEELVTAYEELKQKDNVIRQLERMYEVCQDSSSWTRKQKEAKANVGCQERLSKSSVRLADKWLHIWKKNKAIAADYGSASEKAFEIYLRPNPKSDEASRARFAYAELLFQLGKFRQASEHYAIVGRQTKAKDQAHDARYGALVSLEKAVEDKWSRDDENKFRELALSYVHNHAAGPHRLDIEFKLGFIAYQKARYDEAAPIFKELGRKYLTQEKGVKAQDLYLDILNIRKDYKNLIEYSKGLMAQKLPEERREKLNKIFEEAYFLQVQKLEETGDYAGAIAGYRKFAKENKHSKLAENAAWNATQLLFKTQDIYGAANALVEFQKQFPQSKMATPGLLRAAQTYESLGQLREAAEVLLQVAELEPESRTKWRSLAGDFFGLSGDYTRAANIYKEIRQKSSGNFAFSSLLKLEQMERERGSVSARHQYLVEIANSGRQPQMSLAAVELVEEKFKAKKMTEAFNKAKDVLNMGTEASANAKARARFVQAQVLEDEFKTQSVKSQLEKVTIVLAMKTEKLDKVQRAYQAVIGYGDPKMSVKSLRQLAGCYAHYTKALRDMPVPNGIEKPNEIEAFRGEMEKLAIPMEEKSVETLAEALNQAKKLGLHDGTIPEIQADLNTANLKKAEGTVMTIQPPGMVVPGLSRTGT